MPRYKLLIEYDGADLVGWQRQANGPSVQQYIEESAEALDGAPVTAFGAGRTDAGVHALGMVAHIDLSKDLSVDEVEGALNYRLKPQPISILKAEKVSTEFHARFTCHKRHYLYRLVSRRSPLALDKNRVWRVPYPLDVEAMQRAADYLIGKHDFTTFRSTQCQAQSPVKSLDSFSVRQVGEEVHCRCAAPSFLHNQVRSFVGTLERVGAGKWAPEDVRDALHKKDRSACGPVAPPQGLYFVQADYPASFAVE